MNTSPKSSKIDKQTEEKDTFKILLIGDEGVSIYFKRRKYFPVWRWTDYYIRWIRTGSEPNWKIMYLSEL